MSPTEKKSPPGVPKVQRHQPYDRSTRPNARGNDEPTDSVSSPPETMRDLYLESSRKKYPNFVPQNDFEILALLDYKGPEEGIRAWMDKLVAERVAMQGSLDRVIASAQRFVGRSTKNLTGRKPSPSTPNVFVRPIPNSEWSIRLFPGAASRMEYCLDFVRTSTGEAVNSPFAFELRQVPDPLVPWAAQPGPLVSLERAWGKAQDEIMPGSEKFVLHDGWTYNLKRPGEMTVRFTVPVRTTPARSATPSNVHVLDLPRTVSD